MAEHPPNLIRGEPPIGQLLDGACSCLTADRFQAPFLRAGDQVLIEPALVGGEHERLPVAPELLSEMRGDVGPGIDQQRPVEVREELRFVAVPEQPGIRSDTTISILEGRTCAGCRRRRRTSMVRSSRVG